MGTTDVLRGGSRRRAAGSNGSKGSWASLAPLVAMFAAGCSSAGAPATEGDGIATSALSVGDAPQPGLPAPKYTPQDVRHTFNALGGDTIDCVDFFAEPGVKALAAQGTPLTPPILSRRVRRTLTRCPPR
jgi:hypothetical protein